MGRIFSKVSITALLYMAVAMPLLGLAFYSGENALQSYQRYKLMGNAIIFQRLASAGTDLALAIPSEGMSPPEKIVEARARTESAYSTLMTLYGDAVAQGVSDDVIATDVSNIKANWGRLASFRTIVDDAARTGNFEKVGPAGSTLPVISANAIDMMRRAGELLPDLNLQRSIRGLHAMTMVNDAGLMEFVPGRMYFEGVPLAPGPIRTLIVSRNLYDLFTKPMLENIPSDIAEPYKTFLTGSDNTFLNATREKLYTLEPLPKPDQATADRWVKTQGARIEMFKTMLTTMSSYLVHQAESRLDQLWRDMVFSIAITAVIASLSLVLSFACITTIRRSLRQIVDRMTGLAKGDTRSDVPYQERTDEIGEISRALAYFRTAEIEKQQLQSEAEDMRLAGERDRLEAQRIAEADAERRLQETTQALAAGLQRLADGDMTCEIHEQLYPQFEMLRHNFNKSVTQLREALSAVGGMAVEVDSGSNEISDATGNLAKRTENQAAALEETAAALEEITANLKATTTRTSDARNVAQTARNKAGVSGQVVDSAVTAMMRIEQSSQQITQIIGVIDEIAFQTNLLALNAGVEAARAGEAGKGFAVVAQEVRELAQRSANAAKEIKGLIGNSAVAVDEGVKLVNETGRGLREIETLVREINDHMDAIATAAHEQSTGLSEVNTAVNHMDQVTQQNAAMVEEMNAASVRLASESTQLSALLRRFQLGDIHRRDRDVPVAPATLRRTGS